MRAFRTTLAAACLAGIVPAWSGAADITAEQILTKFRPTFKGIEYDTPADAAAVAACKVEKIPASTGQIIGYTVRDGQGKILRRVINLRPGDNLDQWSYYQDGFEVYREVDLNDDRVLDEARWMNAAGTRVAKIARGRIASWERISAEEASKVVVQALASNDLDLLSTVMATPAELEALGVPKAEVDAVSAAERTRAASFGALRNGLVGWDAETTWLGITAGLPHLIPAESGLKADLFLHENSSIFAGASNDNGSGKTAFLHVGEIVRIGECWKLVDLPRTVDPKSGVVAAFDGGIRSAVFREGGSPAGAENPAVAAAMNGLATYDKTKADLLNGPARSIAQFHVDRITPLNAVVRAAEAAGDEKVVLDHQKLIVDSLAAAYTTGASPGAAKVLEGLVAKGGKIGSYAAYKQIEADFALQNASNNAGSIMEVQDAWLGRLRAFVEKYGQSEEAPQALLLLASTNEMNSREAEARKFYTQLAGESPATEWGKKAAGALRRLDSVGKPLALTGTDLQGKPIDASAYKGKTLLVTFWATWANPARKDLPDLAKLAAKYRARGFEVLAVNLDNDRADLDAFLKSSPPMPWREVYEPGGLESRLATEFGIISLPTMLLVDPDGKVRDRNVRTAAEVEILLDKAFSGKADGGVALRPNP